MTNSINDQSLKDMNKQGLIPGPGESESSYFDRVDYCLQIHKHLSEQTGLPLPTPTHSDTSTSLEEAYQLTQELYDISPKWVPIIYDNHKLSLWHGGCAWIFQSDEESPLSAFLQLRKPLKNKENLFGFFNKREIIAHEMCHVGRMAFEEPLFEEVLAYRTSKSSFRRWIGPIVKNSIESGLFVLILMMIFMLDAFFVFFGSEQAFYQAMWLKLIPLLLVFYGIFRLTKYHRQLDRCLENLKKLSGSESTASAITYRLTDQEILLFGKSSPEEIRAYANKQKKSSLRWKIIDSVYLYPFTKYTDHE
jgi:hypothetical protein